MNHIKSFILTILLLSVSTFTFAASTHTAVYKNERGSTLKLQLHPSQTTTAVGTLTGTFKSAVGNCKEDVNVEEAISGFYNGNAVAFSVSFPHCHLVITMNGNMIKDTITTLWITTHTAKDPAHGDWDASNIGTDHFKKIG